MEKDVKNTCAAGSHKAALEESRQRLDMALKGADLGVWDWNILTGEVAFDERWAAMIGHRLEDIPPHVSSWEKLVHPDDMPAVMAALTEHLEGRSDIYRTEHRMRHKGGYYIWVLDSGRVFSRDTEGRPLRAAGIHLDITARKQAENDREVALSQLSRSNRELDQYAHLIAHDLQQPLAAIAGFIDAATPVLDKSSPEAATLLDNCRKTALEMSASIEYILEFASATRTGGAREITDLRVLAEKTGALMTYIYPEIGDRTTIRITENLPSLYCDPTQMERVFANIIGNAHKHADPERDLTIIVDAAEDASKGGWVISIADNGKGVDSKVQEGLFEAFYRTPAQGRAKGFGLGLAICKKIIAEHNGKIWLESKPDQGTTFFIFLPA